jgi:hypothetical protein
MNRRVCLVFAAVTAVAAAADRPATAWTGATRARMIRDALKVTPPALNAILDHYRQELDRGMEIPSSHETEEVHYQLADGSAGLAAAAVAQKKEETQALLAGKHGLKQFAFEMGTLAHLTADVSFPLNASDADPREPLYREAYRAYIEHALDRIPFVLDPAAATGVEDMGLEARMMESARRTARNYDQIGAAFKDDGTPRTPQSLDERSVPFAVASLAYSQAVNDIVRVWCRLWRASGGDMTGGKSSPPGAAAPSVPAGRKQ